MTIEILIKEISDFFSLRSPYTTFCYNVKTTEVLNLMFWWNFLNLEKPLKGFRSSYVYIKFTLKLKSTRVDDSVVVILN